MYYCLNRRTEINLLVLTLSLALRIKPSLSMTNVSTPPPHLPVNATTIQPEDSSVVSNDFSTALGALILGLVFLLGVPGNFFIVWSILARIRRRSVTTILILNLAFADGFLMILTIFFIVYLARQTWDFGNIMCKGLFYLCNANMYASIFLITLMSVHRLVVLVLPRRVSRMASRKVVRRVIVGMWVLVMVIAIPSLVFRNVREDNAEMNNDRLVCAPNHTEARHVSKLKNSLLKNPSQFPEAQGDVIQSFVLSDQMHKNTRR